MLNKIINFFKRKNNNKEAYTHHRRFLIPFDGAKLDGDIGPIIEYKIDYYLLKFRSWQSYLESEITHTIVNKYVKWIIGRGLKLQVSPNVLLLKNSHIDVSNLSKTSKLIEAKFAIFSSSRRASYSNMESLNKIAKKAYLNVIVGGDVLVVLRVIKNEVKVQLIDGQHVRKGLDEDYNFDEYEDSKNEKKNKIKNGIEMSPSGEHIAYWVTESEGKEAKRIKAKNKLGMVQAFLFYGREYRLDNHRGIPWISVVLETLKKMERYKEASVSSAEQISKVLFFITHGVGSTGENPLTSSLGKIFNAADDSSTQNSNSINDEYDKLAKNIKQTTNNETINMPIDSKLEQLTQQNNLYFKEFYMLNVNLISACLEIPPDVALSMYNGNYSSSRAAIQDWQHTLITNRQSVMEGFYKPIYEYFFQHLFLQGKVELPGFSISADPEIKEAFMAGELIGDHAPHIDPKKEIEAVREKLGEYGKNIPLTTLQQALIDLGNGGTDFDILIERFKDDLEKFNKDLGDLDVIPEDD